MHSTTAHNDCTQPTSFIGILHSKYRCLGGETAAKPQTSGAFRACVCRFGGGLVPSALVISAITLSHCNVCRPAAQALTNFENRRTIEGFDASLTAKKAALLFLFTFAPVVYVGLAGECRP